MSFITYLNQKQIEEQLQKEFKYSTKNINSKGWINNIGSSFNFDNQLVESFNEGIAPEQHGLDKYKGGLIIFSTDVNAVNDNIKNVLVKWFKNNFDTFLNRLNRIKKLDKIITNFKQQYPHENFGAYSIGNFFKGRYVSDNNKVFNEKSISIEILGIPSEFLVPIATEIAKEFKQETVLLKDWDNNKFVLIDRN